MTFLAPGFLIAAALAALGAVAIHFIVTREPRMVPLPTARFAPVRPVRARARALRPQDLLLLLLRVLLILAVGAALAQPVLRPQRRALARILVVDRSRAVADPREAVDSARALLTAGDALVLFDSTPVVVREGAADSLATLASLADTDRRGRLSPALIAALRTASQMRERADSFELAIISPLVAEEVDAATDSIRALWPGGVRLVPVAARRDSARAAVPAIDGASGDPLRVSLPSRRPAGGAVPSGGPRLVRRPLTTDDTARARGEGSVLVHWPAASDDGATSAAAGPSWVRRAAPDTIGAVIAGDVVVVAPFVRHLAYRPSSGTAPDARIVARWADGEPAAVEEPLGAGCLRTVTVDVPSRGDLVLQPRFARFAAAMSAPCGGAMALAPLGETHRAVLAGEPGHAAASAIAPPESVPLPLVPWLLAAALLFAGGALMLQRRIARGADAPVATDARMAEAA